MAEQQSQSSLDRIVSGANNLKTAAVLSQSFWLWIILGTIFSIAFITTTMELGNEGAASEGNQTQVVQQPATQPVQSNSITYWADKISSSLKQFSESCGDTNLWNILTDVVTNGSFHSHNRTGSSCGLAPSTYFCTDLVIDSYNLAGIKNNFSEYSGHTSEGRPGMFDQWSSIPGLSTRQDNDVRGLKPGDAIFWFEDDFGAHVDLISKISVDYQTGDGSITTTDSNMDRRSITWDVNHFELQGNLWPKGVTRTPMFGLGPR